MSEVQAHEPGTFCWVELATTDQQAAKEFYTKLFGWSANDSPMGEGMVYTMLQLGGRNVGALYGMDAEEKGRMPPSWRSYVSVASADEAAEKARAAGAQVLMEPFDVMTFGRMAVLQDPTGATISLWEPKEHIGAQVTGEPGSLCWNELATGDVERAREFYTGLFGWGANVLDMGEMGTYTMFMRGEIPAGGLFDANGKSAVPDMPTAWMPYIAVADCDASAAKAGELGAEIVVPPSDIPGTGRFSLLRDPQGAMISIIRLLPMEQA